MENQQDLKNKLLTDFHGHELIFDDTVVSQLPTLSTQAQLYIRGITERPLVIAIDSGGCSGLQYKFEITSATEDATIICEDPQVYIDNTSLEYMWGSEITVELDNGIRQIVVHNPRAKQSCGCRNSFAYE